MILYLLFMHLFILYLFIPTCIYFQFIYLCVYLFLFHLFVYFKCQLQLSDRNSSLYGMWQINWRVNFINSHYDVELFYSDHSFPEIEAQN